MRHILFAAALLAPTSALARPCTAASLAGIWSLVSIRSADPGVEAFYGQAPNEVMRFGAGAALSMSPEPSPLPPRAPGAILTGPTRSTA